MYSGTDLEFLLLSRGFCCYKQAVCQLVRSSLAQQPSCSFVSTQHICPRRILWLFIVPERLLVERNAAQHVVPQGRCTSWLLDEQVWRTSSSRWTYSISMFRSQFYFSAEDLASLLSDGFPGKPRLAFSIITRPVSNSALLIGGEMFHRHSGDRGSCLFQINSSL